jgi:excisionase family DNA binding protein
MADTKGQRGTDEVEAVFNDRRLSIEEVSDLLGVQQSTVKKWVRDGDLRALKLGKAYQVWMSAVREFKTRREAEASDVLEQRRRERQFRLDLERRRNLEPQLGWDVVCCLQCGVVNVLTTRHQRFDGDVFCDGCRGSGEVGEESLTKDGWERRISLLVSEKNRFAEAVDSAPDWVVRYCPICNKPHAVSDSALIVPTYYLECEHKPPYPGESVEEGQGRLDSRVTDYLARVEVSIRKSSPTSADDDWRITRCTHCADGKAAACRSDRALGTTRCRGCIQKGAEILPYQRASMISGFLGDGSRTVACRCSSWEVVSAGDQQAPILSWCKERPLEQRLQLADAYSKVQRLSDLDQRALRASVGGDDHHSAADGGDHHSDSGTSLSVANLKQLENFRH